MLLKFSSTLVVHCSQTRTRRPSRFYYARVLALALMLMEDQIKTGNVIAGIRTFLKAEKGQDATLKHGLLSSIRLRIDLHARQAPRSMRVNYLPQRYARPSLVGGSMVAESGIMKPIKVSG